MYLWERQRCRVASWEELDEEHWIRGGEDEDYVDEVKSFFHYLSFNI